MLSLMLGVTACGRMDLTSARELLYSHEGQTFESHCRLADDGQNCQDESGNPGSTVPLLPPASYGLLMQLRKDGDTQIQLGSGPTMDTLNVLARQVTITGRRIDPPAPTATGKGTLVFLWTYSAPR